MVPAMRTRLATLTAMVIAAAALVGSACTDDGTDESRSTTTRRATTTSTSASDEPSDTSTSEPTSMDLGESDARVETLVVAGRTARGQVVGSVVVSIDFEGARTPDARRWEVDVATADGVAHEVEISADGTQVVRGPTPKTDSAADRTERVRRLAAATVDFEAATEIVAGRYPAGRITELDLDDSDGRVVWEADVLAADGSKHEVEVDASTGEIVVDRMAD